MPTRIGFLLLALVATGCGLTLELPAAPTGVIGLACVSAVECMTGACVDGVCCERACTPSETCASPGEAGRCRARKLGSPCDADRACAEGPCVDGVCCESSCEGTCLTCNRPDQPGRCVTPSDNADQRRQCGLCGACFEGLCAPAAPGTDPNGSCPDGLTCSPEQTCGQRGGSTCDDARPCAVGDCIAGTCLRATVETIFAVGMNPSAQLRVPQALVVNHVGEVAVVFSEVARDGTSSLASENTLFAVSRSGEGEWHAARLQSDPCGLVSNGELPVASASFLGPTLLVSGYLAGVTLGAGGCRPSGAPVGTFAQLVFPSGDVGRPETVDAATVRDLRHVMRAATDGTPWLFRQTLDGLTITQRSLINGVNGWTAPKKIGLFEYARGWDAVLWGSDAIVFDVDGDSASIRARTLSTMEERSLALPEGGCTLYGLRAQAGDATIDVTFFCGSTPWLGRYTPASGAWALSLVGDGWFAAAPLGSSRLPADAAVVAYARDGLLGEVGLAFRSVDGAWHRSPAFTPTYDAPAWLEAAAGPDGDPVLLVATGTAGPYGAPPRELHLIRYHP